MPTQNDNTVVQVPLSNLEVRICASVPITIDTPLTIIFQVVRTM